MPTLDLGPYVGMRSVCLAAGAGRHLHQEQRWFWGGGQRCRSQHYCSLQVRESTGECSATQRYTRAHTHSLSFALHSYCFERGCAVYGHFDTCWAVCPHTSGPLRSSSGPTRMRTATIWCFRTLPFGTPTGGWASSSGKVALPPTPSPIARSPSVAFLAQLPVLPTSHVGPSSVPLGVTSWGRSTHILTHISPPTPTPFGGVHVQIKWKRVQRAV